MGNFKVASLVLLRHMTFFFSLATRTSYARSNSTEQYIKPRKMIAHIAIYIHIYGYRATHPVQLTRHSALKVLLTIFGSNVTLASTLGWITTVSESKEALLHRVHSVQHNMFAEGIHRLRHNKDCTVRFYCLSPFLKDDLLQVDGSPIILYDTTFLVVYFHKISTVSAYILIPEYFRISSKPDFPGNVTLLLSFITKQRTIHATHFSSFLFTLIITILIKEYLFMVSIIDCGVFCLFIRRL